MMMMMMIMMVMIEWWWWYYMWLLGAITSIASGYIGMRVAVFSNVRTTINAQKPGYAPAFNTAFRAGAVMVSTIDRSIVVDNYANLFDLLLMWYNHQLSGQHTYMHASMRCSIIKCDYWESSMILYDMTWTLFQGLYCMRARHLSAIHPIAELF